MGFQVIVHRGASHRATHYTLDQIDIVAAFIAPLDAWYLVPIEKLGTRRLVFFYPEGKKMPFAGLYEEYRDAWHLLKEEKKLPAPLDELVARGSTSLLTGRSTSCAKTRVSARMRPPFPKDCVIPNGGVFQPTEGSGVEHLGRARAERAGSLRPLEKARAFGMMQVTGLVRGLGTRPGKPPVFSAFWMASVVGLYWSPRPSTNHASADS